MKLVLLLLSLTPFFLSAQNDNRNRLNPERLEVEEFKLEADKTAPPGINLPFKNIKVIDSRFDTSKIGFIPNPDNFSKKKAFKKMVLKGGNGNAIETYYNDQYAESFTANDFELLIVVKRFWVGGNASSNNKRMEVANSGKENSSIHCKWEYYIGKNGNYLPVKRMDTVFTIDVNFRNYLNDGSKAKMRKLVYIKNTLATLIELLDFSNAITQFDRQAKKTLAQIGEFNERMNNIPVLKDSSYKKGVYLSFDEFKNKQPSIIDFQEKKMHYGTFNANTEVYLEDMKGQTISNYWGYSDGKDFRYGMLGNEKMYRIQNTFCFFIKVMGYTIDKDNEGYFGGSSTKGISKDKYEVWVPFQIDMETGEIY